jgi:hypothetical protein
MAGKWLCIADPSLLMKSVAGNAEMDEFATPA